MKQLGTVKNVIHDGSILVSVSGFPADCMPARGIRVFDRRGLPVGRVARVFGPVNAPYVSLRPEAGTETLGLLGTALYLDPEERPPAKPVRKGGHRERPRAGSLRKKGVKSYRRKEKRLKR